MEKNESIGEESVLTLKKKKEQKQKEKILDESYKKAEINCTLRKSNVSEKKIFEKTFPKIGIIIIILALVGLIIINNAPWAFIKYNSDLGSTETTLYRDISKDNNQQQPIMELFEAPYYSGLSKLHFSNTPQSSFNGFIILIIIGLLITIFGIINKNQKYSKKTSKLVHYIFLIITVIPCIFINLSVMKFLSAHLLLFYNISQITNLSANINITFITFPAAFMIITLGFIIIKIELTLLKIDLKELKKIVKAVTSTSKKLLSKDVIRGGP
jgi:hypothetical protein